MNKSLREFSRLNRNRMAPNGWAGSCWDAATELRAAVKLPEIKQAAVAGLIAVDGKLASYNKRFPEHVHLGASDGSDLNADTVAGLQRACADLLQDIHFSPLTNDLLVCGLLKLTYQLLTALRLNPLDTIFDELRNIAEKRGQKLTSADEEIGAVLRRMRISKGVSQRAAAQKLGVTASYLSRLESGRRRVSVSMAANLCAELGKSLADFEKLLNEG